MTIQDSSRSGERNHPGQKSRIGAGGRIGAAGGCGAQWRAAGGALSGPDPSRTARGPWWPVSRAPAARAPPAGSSRPAQQCCARQPEVGVRHGASRRV